jgi:hypothetical protein
MVGAEALEASLIVALEEPPTNGVVMKYLDRFEEEFGDAIAGWSIGGIVLTVLLVILLLRVL